MRDDVSAQRMRTVYCHEWQRPETVLQIMRFRKRILVDRYGWNLRIAGDLERDEFDTDEAVHGAIFEGPEIKACFRLSRTDFPYLAREQFGHLATNKPYPQSSAVWEISRLAVAEDRRPFETVLYTYSAIFHFARSRGAASLVAFADLAKERLVTRIGIVTDLLGPPTEIGKDRFGRPIVVVAGELPLRLQGGPRFEKLLTYIDRTEIDDAAAIFGRARIPA